jgi:hypothetical protein
MDNGQQRTDIGNGREERVSARILQGLIGERDPTKASLSFKNGNSSSREHEKEKLEACVGLRLSMKMGRVRSWRARGEYGPNLDSFAEHSKRIDSISEVTVETKIDKSKNEKEEEEEAMKTSKRERAKEGRGHGSVNGNLPRCEW